jgi:hypothetical protein
MNWVHNKLTPIIYQMLQIDRHLLDLAAENLLEVATTQAMEMEAQSSLVKECLVVIHKEGD